MERYEPWAGVAQLRCELPTARATPAT
jgi:hypothetical protein